MYASTSTTYASTFANNIRGHNNTSQVHVLFNYTENPFSNIDL